MKLTHHGEERVLGRTKMMTQDVLSIITADAVVELGFSNGYELLLFYSLPDRCTKIALVNKGRTTLVSIWEDDFILPSGVLRVTWPLRNKAHELFTRYLFKRVCPKNGTEAGERPVLKLEVLMGEVVEYERTVGPISFRESNEKSLVFAHATPLIRSVLDVAEQLAGDVRKRLRCRAVICEPISLRPVRDYWFSYATITRMISASV